MSLHHIYNVHNIFSQTFISNRGLPKSWSPILTNIFECCLLFVTAEDSWLQFGKYVRFSEEMEFIIFLQLHFCTTIFRQQHLVPNFHSQWDKFPFLKSNKRNGLFQLVIYNTVNFPLSGMYGEWGLPVAWQKLWQKSNTKLKQMFQL
jgi:hypothetical protein